MGIANRRSNRRGVAAAEFALVAPIFITLVLGMIEVGRALMVQQVLINGSREGARKAVLAGATVSDVKNYVEDFLASSAVPVPLENITVNPDPASAANGDPISVSITVPYSDVNWLPVAKYVDGSLQASTVMRRENFD